MGFFFYQEIEYLRSVMLKILVEGVILYLLYRFVVRFVIPVYRSVRRARKQMKEMQNRMNDQMQHRQQNPHSKYQNPHSQYQNRTQDTPPQSSPQRDEGEYIDYEEVK